MRAVKESKPSRRSRFLREAMVDVQIASRGIRSRRILLAMRQVPRELFLDRRFAEAAYEDVAVPIPKGQTISQPYIVAKMLEAAAIAKSDRVMEIGAGSGYLAALAAKLGGRFARSSAMKHWCSAPDRAFGISAAATWICVRATGPQDGRTRRVRRDPGVGRRRADARGPQDSTSSVGATAHALGDPDGVQWLTKLTRGPDDRFVEERIEEVRFVPLVSTTSRGSHDASP